MFRTIAYTCVAVMFTLGVFLMEGLGFHGDVALWLLAAWPLVQTSFPPCCRAKVRCVAALLALGGAALAYVGPWAIDRREWSIPLFASLSLILALVEGVSIILIFAAPYIDASQARRRGSE